MHIDENGNRVPAFPTHMGGLTMCDGFQTEDGRAYACDGATTMALTKDGVLTLIVTREEWPRATTLVITEDEADVLADQQESKGDPVDQVHDTREAADKLRGNPHTYQNCAVCAEFEEAGTVT